MTDKTKPIDDLNDIKAFKQALEQEKICFEENKKHFIRWNILKLIMGYSALLILICVIFICGFIIINHSNFTEKVLIFSVSVLLLDLVLLMITIYKIVLKNNNIDDFKPITKRKD